MIIQYFCLFSQTFLKQNKIVKTLVYKTILYSIQQKTQINLLLLYFNQSFINKYNNVKNELPIHN